MDNKYFGQLKQDKFIEEYFKYFIPRTRVFIDVGAFDGISFSNTHYFFLQGWSGICIEPVKKNFEKLTKLYLGTKVLTVCAAATDFDGQITLNVATIPWAHDWGSDVSSRSENTMKRFPEYQWDKEIVPATTLNTLLTEKEITDFDFISIDVEGHEIAVLKGLDLSMYHPQIILVEYSSKTERKELVNYLKPFGYSCWHDNKQDLFMVHGKWRRNFKSLFLVIRWYLSKFKIKIENLTP